MINKLIVIYYPFLFCSVGVGLLGGGAGLVAISKWRFASTPEMRVELEKKFYLSSSAIFLGAVLRLIMLPLWFVLLQSLILVIPGAMCLGGVHQSVPFYSWSASAMKLILPLFYFSWIAITMIDRKIVDQPFLKFRYFFLLPMVLFIIGETFLDLKFLGSIKPVVVTCCTALFDYNPGNVPQLFTESHWYFVIAFCIALAGQIIFLMLTGKRAISVSIMINAIVLFITLLFALHTKLSPLVLEAPFHHCVFCLLQGNVYVLAGSILLLIGVYLSFTYGLIGFARNSMELHGQIIISLGRIKLLALAAYVIGFILILLPVMKHLNDNGGF